MGSINSTINKMLVAHPRLRNAIRWLRWQLKKVPFLRNISMAIDRRYFSASGEERPDDHNGIVGDVYFEKYATALSKKSFGRVLELGCGHGYLSARLAAEPAVSEIVALDKIDNFKNPHKKITYQTRDLSIDAPLPAGFNTVVTSEFIEHISEDDFERLLRRVREALAVNGIFIGSTPRNPTPYKVFSGSRFHLREYNKKDLIRILEKYFKKVKVVPLSEYCLMWEASN